MSTASASDSAKKTPKPKLTPKAAKAVKRLQRIEDGLLHVQATLPAYLREVKETREDIESAAPAAEEAGTK